MIKITITETAKNELLKVLARFDAKTVRLTQQGYGWTGPTLGMVLDEPGEQDETVYLEGFQFIYNTHENDLLDGTLIDYKDSWYGEGFTVCSPQSEPCWKCPDAI